MKTHDPADYGQFLKTKGTAHGEYGLGIVPALNDGMFPFQRDITAWALRKGRAAVFADCGLGKTVMQLEWARHVPGKVLILAPLAVAPQTVREGEKFGVAVAYNRKGCADQAITVTNYEMLDRFDASEFTGVVLDESSILKSYDGKMRTAITERFATTPFKLACTATPAPNDFMEIGNHAEFVGALTRTEMLSTFFVHDGGETAKWRLKGHAEAEFWKWVSSWAVMIRCPSDLGYDDDGFILPPLTTTYVQVDADEVKATDGALFALPASTLRERQQARSGSIAARAAKVAEMIAADPKGPWIVWCNLNAEADAVRALIPDAVEVRGSDSLEDKESAILTFAGGTTRVLVTKPSIAGFGVNWQCCARVIFLGLSDSYEQFYQAVRRCWRFGQSKKVLCAIITSSLEGAVVQNIQRKEADAQRMAEEMAVHMRDLTRAHVRGASARYAVPYRRRIERGRTWELALGDCVDATRDMAADSLHYSIFSPPFASLYTYSASDRDMGNCRTHGEFYEHFGFLVRELHRVTMPGRLLSFHCMNLPTSKERDGVIGIADFRGDLIRMFQAAGFIYHSEVVIWKDPVTAMQRTKALGLLHKQIKKDSCMSRQGIPDYLVTMRKRGDNPERVTHTAEEFPVDVWQRYASPVWMDINPSNTLQRTSAREDKDERHICPLQLEVIERALKLWTNPRDTVFSPFAGIGSEGYVAIRVGRRFMGVELKESYFAQAAANLADAERTADGGLFGVAE